jgi:glucose/arabinose dehydrogenase
MYFSITLKKIFGLDFDPLTGNLWDTENGPRSYDEINLVRPGFKGDNGGDSNQ